MLSERASSDEAIVPLGELQRSLRPLYGLGEPQPACIGNHPDFDHLRETGEVAYCPITTLFMDIEGSTRLSLLYDLEQVKLIKNAFIQATIEIVKAFDGHVHRIMGDAVMAYFGGREVEPEQGVVNALNCASVLRYFTEAVVIPQLSADGLTDPFGIRIGLDFGKEQDVLWSVYGYPDMEEVTATSFYVDVAAKLQQSAGRNNIMIGQSLQDFVDFPSELLSMKKRTQDGVLVDDPYIRPNYSDQECSILSGICPRRHLLKLQWHLPRSLRHL